MQVCICTQGGRRSTGEDDASEWKRRAGEPGDEHAGGDRGTELNGPDSGPLRKVVDWATYCLLPTPARKYCKGLFGGRNFRIWVSTPTLD